MQPILKADTKEWIENQTVPITHRKVDPDEEKTELRGVGAKLDCVEYRSEQVPWHSHSCICMLSNGRNVGHGGFPISPRYYTHTQVLKCIDTQIYTDIQDDGI